VYRVEALAAIVCGIGSATEAPLVLETAHALAGASTGPLVVIHVFDEPVRDADELMASIRRQTADDPTVDVRLIEGSPADQLLEIARAENAAFLVVGSRGRGPIASRVLGSVSRRLVEEAPCPVVVVPPNAAAPAERRDGEPTIVAGVDGSKHALAAVRVARELRSRLGYRVAVVHAPRSVGSLTYVGRSTTPSLSEQPDAVDRRSREIVEEAVDVLGDPQAPTFVEAGRPDEILQRVAERENGRLLVIAARGAGAIQASLLGSIAFSLISSADVPVVVLSEVAERGAA
jgi:nucleotide-binding universal stress UspA family protein